MWSHLCWDCMTIWQETPEQLSYACEWQGADMSPCRKSTELVALISPPPPNHMKDMKLLFCLFFLSRTIPDINTLLRPTFKYWRWTHMLGNRSCGNMPPLPQDILLSQATMAKICSKSKSWWQKAGLVFIYATYLSFLKMSNWTH